MVSNYIKAFESSSYSLAIQLYNPNIPNANFIHDETITKQFIMIETHYEFDCLMCA